MNFKVLDNNTTERLLFKAMCQAASLDRKMVTDKFGITPAGDSTEAKLTVLVNDIEVPFTEVFKRVVDDMVDEIDRKVQERAIQLLKDRVGSVMESLERIEHQLDCEVYEVLQVKGEQ